MLIEKIDTLLGVINWNVEVNRRIDRFVYCVEIVSIVSIERIDTLLGVIIWNSEVNRQIDIFVYCDDDSVYSVDSENRHIFGSNKVEILCTIDK